MCCSSVIGATLTPVVGAGGPRPGTCAKTRFAAPAPAQQQNNTMAKQLALFPDARDSSRAFRARAPVPKGRVCITTNAFTLSWPFWRFERAGDRTRALNKATRRLFRDRRHAEKMLRWVRRVRDEHIRPSGLVPQQGQERHFKLSRILVEDYCRAGASSARRAQSLAGLWGARRPNVVLEHVVAVPGAGVSTPYLPPRQPRRNRAGRGDVEAVGARPSEDNVPAGIPASRPSTG